MSLRVLITADSAGALWQYSTDLACGLGRLGIQTVLAVLGPSPTEAQRSLARRVPGIELVENIPALDRFAEDGRALSKAGAAIARLAQDCGADLVQLNNAALAAQTRFDVPVVAVHHSCVSTWWEAVNGTELPAEHAWRTRLTAAGLEAADIVVTPTAAFGEMVMRRYRLRTMPRAVHHGRRLQPLPPTAPHDFAFTVGRLSDEGQNLDMLDSAAGELGVPFRAAGPVRGPDGAEVLFDNIHCIGALEEDELARWLSARPVFVSAALYEPFGVAVLEAAAAGCPLILSDIPSFRELWDGIALFVPARDERGFTDTISTLVSDDFERAVLGRAAKERAMRFTPDAMASQMASIYRGLLPAVRRPVLAAARAA